VFFFFAGAEGILAVKILLNKNKLSLQKDKTLTNKL